MLHKPLFVHNDSSNTHTPKLAHRVARAIILSSPYPKRNENNLKCHTVWQNVGLIAYTLHLPSVSLNQTRCCRAKCRQSICRTTSVLIENFYFVIWALISADVCNPEPAPLTVLYGFKILHRILRSKQ